MVDTERRMKLCPYCSGAMDNESTVCQLCGRDWKSGASVASPKGSVPPVPREDPERTSLSWAQFISSENHALWRFLFGVVVIFCVILLWWIFAWMPS